ncbi:hypothetical protein [Rhizobium nepotum]|uniref:NYN domain-containing protein n=1 Tax=Rhizobium nepotum 39/7 TaxID=1368418 RepID=A0ABR5CK52_9HYPH|nr:hypothetical protein [Rhizobium nepotum]KJF65232.1 hypothetical protein RS75_24250 [Rhizobium nepotum 39/7]
MRCDLIAVTVGSMAQAAMETVMDAGSFARTKRRSATTKAYGNVGHGTGRYRHRLAVLIDGDNVPSKVMDGLFGMRGRW